MFDIRNLRLAEFLAHVTRLACAGNVVACNMRDALASLPHDEARMEYLETFAQEIRLLGIGAKKVVAKWERRVRIEQNF